MCFIISNDLYTAHHKSLGICHQLNIRHLYRTLNFLTQCTCICMGTKSLFVHGFRRFRGKALSTRKTVFVVASIVELIAIMKRLIDKFISYCKPVCMDDFSKQRNQEKIRVAFLLLISKLKGVEFLNFSSILLMSEATCRRNFM